MKAAVERISVTVVVPKEITGASIFQAIKNATLYTRVHLTLKLQHLSRNSCWIERWRAVKWTNVDEKFMDLTLLVQCTTSLTTGKWGNRISSQLSVLGWWSIGLKMLPPFDKPWKMANMSNPFNLAFLSDLFASCNAIYTRPMSTHL